MEQGETQPTAGNQESPRVQGSAADTGGRPHEDKRPERPRTQGAVPAPVQGSGQGQAEDAAQAQGQAGSAAPAQVQAQARQERLEETAALLKRCFHKMQRGERSSQGHVMGLLWRKGELTQRELQSYMKISQASLSELVKKLEERGMVERSADPNDRRRVLVRLTEQGRLDHQEHLRRSLDRGVALLDVLDPEEQDELYRLLQKMLAGGEALETAAPAAGAVSTAGPGSVPAAKPAPTPAPEAPEGEVSRR